MSEQDLKRFYEFRQKVFDLIRKVDDGYHKSYEGAMDITFSFPNIFEAESIQGIDFVEINLHCYLLINGRHECWKGRTFGEALDKAEAWLKHVTWIEQ